MVEIKTIEEAHKVLYKYMPKRREMTKSGEMILDRIWPLMKLLGNPQDKLKVLHIAGTSGKTSTAYFASALLHATGQKVGLTVSPFVDHINERIQINGVPIDDKTFCSELSKLINIVDEAGQYPSYFELVYAFSIWVMANQGVDYAVVETGVGGLYDATNVNQKPDKVCIITDIGFDHMHLLGNTLPDIATQKAGIIHEHNETFMYEQAPEIMSVVKQWCTQHKAPLNLVKPNSDTPKGMPSYQYRNWQLAYAAVKFIIGRDGLRRLDPDEITRTQHVVVPGRMDVRKIKGKTVVMDGAHNAQKMTAFVDSFRELYPGIKPATMVAVKSGKEYKDVVNLLAPLVSRVITTSFDTAQDLRYRSMDPSELAEAFRMAGVPSESIPDEHDALNTLLNGPEEVCLITGSFYMLGQIRNNEHLI